MADMEFRVPPCVEEVCVAAAWHGIYGYTMRTSPTRRRCWTDAAAGLQAKEDILIVRGWCPPGVAIRH